MLKPVNEVLLSNALRKYSYIYTMEEGFINKGGLDSIITNIVNNLEIPTKLRKFGFSDRYVFEVGNRDHLYMVNGLDGKNIVKTIKKDVMKGYS
jgi:transketolase